MENKNQQIVDFDKKDPTLVDAPDIFIGHFEDVRSVFWGEIKF